MAATRAPIVPVLGSWITLQASMGTVFSHFFSIFNPVFTQRE
jgi:hypothetical protein